MSASKVESLSEGVTGMLTDVRTGVSEWMVVGMRVGSLMAKQ